MEGRGGAAQGARHGVGGDGFEDPFQEAGRSGCGSSVFDTVSLCADDADAAGGRLLRAVHPASASEGLDDPSSSDICHGVWRPQSCLRSKQRRPVEERNGRRDSPRSLQHVDGTPTDSRELSLAFVETVYAGLARLQDQDRTLSLETLSYILPCLLMKQVRSTTGRERRAYARPLCSGAFRV